MSTVGRLGVVVQVFWPFIAEALACSDWIAVRYVFSLVCSRVRPLSVPLMVWISDAVNASRSEWSWTSALGVVGLLLLPNSAFAATTGLFWGSIGVPFQNSMPWLSRPYVWWEQAPRMSGFTFNALAMSWSMLVRGVVVSVAPLPSLFVRPDRQSTIPSCVAAAPGY